MSSFSNVDCHYSYTTKKTKEQSQHWREWGCYFLVEKTGVLQIQDQLGLEYAA